MTHPVDTRVFPTRYPAKDMIAVTPNNAGGVGEWAGYANYSDEFFVPITRIMHGTAAAAPANIVIDTLAGQQLTITRLAAGIFHEIPARRVYDENTTATNIIGAIDWR